MAIPEADLALIDRWCADQWAEQFRDEVFCEHHVEGDSITLCETRAPWNGEGGWTHERYAQLRLGRSGSWALFCADSDENWHPYGDGGRQVVGSCADLLAEIDRDPTGIFKG